ncbi:MAG: 8-amino-7-oxononanoate synthase [Chloroflexi bacterium]|nr:MAG: 8-amino-7-oxononanoate synthase [Chloroflexota bacterium]
MQETLRARLTGELDALKEKHLYRRLRVVDGEQKAVCVIDGKEVINLSSNNYLGLDTHPYLKQKAEEAVRELGVGSGAVRTIIGTMQIHQELEERLAKFKHTEATLTFQSGFTANTGVLGSLMEDGDAIISDELNHASIIDGIRLSKAKRFIYRHSDMNHLEEQLKAAQGARTRLVVTDGVFSMDGDLAPLDKIVDLSERYGAMVFVDDAHASGVFGKDGRGTVDHFGLHGRVHVQVGTLSKAIGVLGGYVACSQALRELLIHKGRPFLFSTSHPPGVTAACIEAIDVLRTEPLLIERLWDNTRHFKDGLHRLGLNTGNSQSPITPVIAGSGEKATRLSNRLFEEGVFAQGIGYPTVPDDRSRVRTIVTATHTREDLDAALHAFEVVGQELDLVGAGQPAASAGA